jgi:hypothetical protein
MTNKKDGFFLTCMAMIPLFITAVVFNLKNCFETSNWWSRGFSIACVVFVVISSFLFIPFRQNRNKDFQYCVRITEISEETPGGIELFIGYILPLVSVNVTDGYSLGSFCFLFLIFFLSVWISRLYFKNVLLILFGFRLYQIHGKLDEDDSKEYILNVCSPTSLVNGRDLYISLLTSTVQIGQLARQEGNETNGQHSV